MFCGGPSHLIKTHKVYPLASGEGFARWLMMPKRQLTSVCDDQTVRSNSHWVQLATGQPWRRHGKCRGFTLWGKCTPSHLTGATPGVPAWWSLITPRVHRQNYTCPYSVLLMYKSAIRFVYNLNFINSFYLQWLPLLGGLILISFSFFAFLKAEWIK